MDPESQAWLTALRSHGPGYEHVVAELHGLLLRAARQVAQRRRGSLPSHVVAELDDLARQAADDALIAILRKLNTYRGASRFTTWAFKFAILEVSAALRRETWRDRPVTMDETSWRRLVDLRPSSPASEAEAAELLALIQRLVPHMLTPRQREVFMAVVVGEVPIDVLADRLNSTRGAIYKILHDARRQIRTQLAAQGWSTMVDRMGAE
jgi:RNA polymerase sigma-70 factor (ECF subfamily)